SIAQIGWVAQIIWNFPIGTSILFAIILGLIELSGPMIAERKDGGTPWHAHHIAERYSLFAIIALGEGVVGTIATLS
ncbi:low temperature requirement protein A, partial [Clostridium perfringens]